MLWRYNKLIVSNLCRETIAGVSHTGCPALSEGIVGGVCEKLCALSVLFLVRVQALVEIFCKALADAHPLCEAGFLGAEVGLGNVEDSAYGSAGVS